MIIYYKNMQICGIDYISSRGINFDTKTYYKVRFIKYVETAGYKYYVLYIHGGIQLNEWLIKQLTYSILYMMNTFLYKPLKTEKAEGAIYLKQSGCIAYSLKIFVFGSLVNSFLYNFFYRTVET